MYGNLAPFLAQGRCSISVNGYRIIQVNLGEGASLPKASLALPVGGQPRATAAPAGLGLEVWLCRSQWRARSKSAQLWLEAAQLGPRHGRGGRAGIRAQPRAGVRGSSSGSAADLKRALPLPREACFPVGTTEPPESISRGSRRQGSRQHLQEDLLLGQERQVLEGRTAGLGVSRPPGGRARPATRSGTPLPSAGPRASSAGPGVPRTWYSASSSLDRRLPEPPIAAPRAVPPTRLGTPATFSLPPSGRVTARSPRQPLLGPPSPGPPPLLNAPRNSQLGSAAGSRLRAVLGELEAGPWAGPAAPGRSPGLTAPPPGMGGAGHAACVRAGRACVEGTATSQWLP